MLIQTTFGKQTVSSSPHNKAIKEDKEIDIGKQILKGASVITASEIYIGHN